MVTSLRAWMMARVGSCASNVHIARIILLCMYVYVVSTLTNIDLRDMFTQIAYKKILQITFRKHMFLFLLEQVTSHTQDMSWIT
jgi:hypothetical protein